MEIAFIANPTAGRGRAAAFVERFAARATNLAIDVKWTHHPGHATALAREAKRQHCDVVCVAGGDGTVHEVVAGLMPDPIPIVVVPSGSGNDFASLIGCPVTPEALHAVLRDGMGVRFDVIDCGIRYCANSVGLGFEALVTKKSRSIKGLRGLPLYLAAVARALVRFDSPPMRIEFDDEVLAGENLLVSIGNGVRAGGGFYLTPDALPDDGRIDVCVVERMGRLRILSLLPRAIPGRHTDARGVSMKRARELTVTASRPFHMHIDGEYVGEFTGPLQFRVLDRVLPVLCRADAPARTMYPLERIL